MIVHKLAEEASRQEVGFASTISLKEVAAKARFLTKGIAIPKSAQVNAEFLVQVFMVST